MYKCSIDLSYDEILIVIKNINIPWPESASELYRPSDRCLSAKLVPTFVGTGSRVGSVTDPYGRNFDFLDRLIIIMIIIIIPFLFLEAKT
jgi:hypothetical protein